jgi:hypothetical protein
MAKQSLQRTKDVKLDGPRNCLLKFENLEGKDESTWILLETTGWTSISYKFSINDRIFAWIRTHDSDLNAGRLDNKDFKLEQENYGRVLVVLRFNYDMIPHEDLATIDYYVELGQQLELVSLAAVLGIEERVSPRLRMVKD